MMTSPFESIEDMLVCPVDGSKLRLEGGQWVSEQGRRYPDIQGIPVLLRQDVDATLHVMDKSRQASETPTGDSTDPWMVETLGMHEVYKERLLKELRQGGQAVDPVVSHMVGATCGNLYRGLVGSLPRYPIPHFRLGEGNGKVLVDLGCNWGRWSVAAAQKGYNVIGIDPQIGALLAAKRVAEQLGVKAHFICADARHIPLRAGVADVIFSYSVIQHFSRADIAEVIASSRQVLKNGGRMYVQMPNVAGLRCFYQWARRGFNDGSGFDVRYLSLRELRGLFEKIGGVNFEIDCFFGIGLQPSDADLMPAKWRLLLHASESLRRLEKTVPGLAWVADSVYVNAVKQA